MHFLDKNVNVLKFGLRIWKTYLDNLLNNSDISETYSKLTSHDQVTWSSDSVQKASKFLYLIK